MSIESFQKVLTEHPKGAVLKNLGEISFFLNASFNVPILMPAMPWFLPFVNVFGEIWDLFW